ncbi:aminotransferase class V-fold PLP-dependent enzyme [Ancylobacter sp. Lp-2]|uniref:aminotransferase class V-fold PLP-dependent enzyme n=1 Tax=Ancylobacter sp. Lp-2 TaxID=2881339 RepID=UPI001E2BEF75|nr:aminotransferase class V-fold PLP-dependent enzyme [Ancylobacter sp. Lp-2]MCB4768472.1 aminotransferase class V-fold PLP-dependent enzyme [Ancylobacter sp. Lp-2]
MAAEDTDTASLPDAPAAPLLPRTEFVGLPDGVSHLYAGGEAPVLRAVLDALADYAADKSGGGPGRRRMEERVEAARAALGRRLRLPHPERRLAFTASVSHAMDLAARALTMTPGDIVMLDDEFPSLPLAFAGRPAEAGALRFVPAGEGAEQRLIAAIGPRTRAVCVSHVSFLTGRRLDLAPLAATCRAAGAALLVDVSHAAGVVEIPVECCDILVACTHKFLLGLHGAGFLYWNEERLGPCPVVAPGWNSAARYRVADGRLDWAPRDGMAAIEAGNPNFGSLYALKAALDRVDALPLRAVESHALALAGRLKAMLAARDIPLWTPMEAGHAGSSVAIPCAEAGAVAARLAEEGLLVAASDGRLRLSFHLHNARDDVDRAATALAAVLP